MRVPRLPLFLIVILLLVVVPSFATDPRIGDVAANVGNTKIVKLNAADGSVYFSVSMATDGALAVDPYDFGVYTGNGSHSLGGTGTVIKLDSTGSLVWSKSVTGGGICGFYYVSGAAVDATSASPGVVWTETGCYGAFAKTNSSGTQLWSASTNDLGRASIDPSTGDIYAVTNAGSSFNYDTIYKATSGGSVTSAGSCEGLTDVNGVDGTLYRGGGSGSSSCGLILYQMNKGTLGATDWSLDLSSKISSFDGLAVQPWTGGYIYAASASSSKVVVIDPATQSIIRTFTTAIGPHSIAVSPLTGNLYISDGSSHFVYAYSPTGTLVWTSPDLGGPVYGVASPKQTAPDTVARILMPANGASGVDGSVPVQVVWTPVATPQTYYLYVGTTVGGTDVYTSGEILKTSVSLSLSANTTYYLRLFTKQNNGWSYVDSSFSTGQLGKDAIITSPANGATNVDSSSPVNVSWIGGLNVASYYLYVGTSAGAADTYTSGPTLNTSAQVRLQPSTTYYCRIFTKNTSNRWSFTDSSFTTGSQGTPAAITSPTDGTINVDGSVPISVTWNSVSGAQSYYLYVGTTPGGTDVYTSGETSATSASLSRFINSSTIYYVRLWTKFASGWKYRDTTFTTGSQQLMAYLLAPANGATGIPNPFGILIWIPATNPQAYFVYVGTTPGAKDVFSSGQTLATSAPFCCLSPSTTYYVRMWTKNAIGVWHYNDSTFTTGP